MSKISGKRVMSGTWGQLWWNGELIAELESFQAKVSINKDTIQMCGVMMEDSKATSAKGTGSIGLKKVYSRFTEYAAAILNGKDERGTIVAKLDDPDAFGAERVAVYGVGFDDATLMDFAAGSHVKTTHPFTFTGHDWLDKVTA